MSSSVIVCHRREELFERLEISSIFADSMMRGATHTHIYIYIHIKEWLERNRDASYEMRFVSVHPGVTRLQCFLTSAAFPPGSGPLHDGKHTRGPHESKLNEIYNGCTISSY